MHLSVHTTQTSTMVKISLYKDAQRNDFTLTHEHHSILNQSILLFVEPYLQTSNNKNVNSLRPSDAFICVSKLISIGSDNGLSPERRQAIFWTNAGILLIGTSGTNFSQILSEIRTFPLKKMHLKMLSAKWRQFCLGLHVLKLHTVCQINPLHKGPIILKALPCHDLIMDLSHTLIARFMGPTWGPSGADRTQVGPMLAPWTLLSGYRNYRETAKLYWMID